MDQAQYKISFLHKHSFPFFSLDHQADQTEFQQADQNDLVLVVIVEQGMNEPSEHPSSRDHQGQDVKASRTVEELIDEVAALLPVQIGKEEKERDGEEEGRKVDENRQSQEHSIGEVEGEEDSGLVCKDVCEVADIVLEQNLPERTPEAKPSQVNAEPWVDAVHEELETDADKNKSLRQREH